MAISYISKRAFSANTAFALADPPTWTRLEPQGTSGDPRPGIEARVHDPLWLLARQWQLGEFEGEDAGTPLTVRVVTTTSPVDRWAPGDVADSQPFSRVRQELLEPLVEREPAAASSAGLRPRAEAGASLWPFQGSRTRSVPRWIRGSLPVRSRRGTPPRRHSRITRRPVGSPGPTAWRPRDGRRRADLSGSRGCRRAAQWVIPASAAETNSLLAIIEPWVEWYRADVSPRRRGRRLVGERLEYRFRVGAGTAVFDAAAHPGGDIDWHSLTVRPPAPRCRSRPAHRPRPLKAARFTRFSRARCAIPACRPIGCGSSRTRKSISVSSKPNRGILRDCSLPSSRLPMAMTGSRCPSTYHSGLCHGSNQCSTRRLSERALLCDRPMRSAPTTAGACSRSQSRLGLHRQACLCRRARWPSRTGRPWRRCSMSGIKWRIWFGLWNALFKALAGGSRSGARAFESGIAGPWTGSAGRTRLPPADRRASAVDSVPAPLDAIAPLSWFKARCPAPRRGCKALGQLLNRPDTQLLKDAEVPREGIAVDDSRA